MAMGTKAWGALLLLFGLAWPGVHAQLDSITHASSFHDTPHTRRIYYLGGQYSSPTNTSNYVGQVYTEQLIPVGGVRKPNPLVFFHCGSLSGAQWLQTPDNREGWASYFLGKGYAVYLIDIASTARSSRLPNEPVVPPFAVSTVESAFTAPQHFNLYPQAHLYTQWPGTGLRGDPIFDAFYPSAVSTPSTYNVSETAVGIAICDLLDRIGSSFLIGHAYGMFFPWPVANRCSEKVQGIFGMESDPQPFTNIGGTPGFPYGISNVPLDYVPAVSDPVADLPHETVGVSDPSFSSCVLQKEPAKQLPKFKDIPILEIIAQAGPHASIGHCQPEYLRQAGATVSLVYLADIGIYGNGQLVPLEKNNLVIAKYLLKWLESREGVKGRKNLTDISSKHGTVAALAKALGLNNLTSAEHDAANITSTVHDNSTATTDHPLQSVHTS